MRTTIGFLAERVLELKKLGATGRQPIGLERMLRIPLSQYRFKLVDLSCEDPLYSYVGLRRISPK